MYALVFWLLSKKWSIEPVSKFPKGTQKGDEIRTKHKKEYYKVRILQISEDKKFLESIEVSTDGEIMPAKRKRQRSDESESKKIKERKTTMKKMRQDTIERLSEELLQRNLDDDAQVPFNPVPGQSNVSSYSRELPRKQRGAAIEQDKEDEKKVEDIKKQRRIESESKKIETLKTTTNKKRQDTLERSSEELLEGNLDDDAEVPLNPVPSASNEASYSRELPRKHLTVAIEQLVRDKEESNLSTSRTPSPIHRPRSKNEEAPVMPRSVSPMPQVPAEIKPREIEIKPGSGVFVNRADLKLIEDCYRKPPVIAWKLMLYLIGAEKLCDMTAKGVKTKPSADGREEAREGISPQVLEAVKYFCDKKGAYKMAPSEYIKVLNNQIGNLRMKRKTERRTVHCHGDSSDES